MVHIAIVEDDKIYQQQLQEYIRKYETENHTPFKITLYSDGEDIVENYSGAYDIILLDIQMDFMDGMTAARTIRERDHEVVIMFITSLTQYAVQGYEVDAMDYIVKPVEYFAFSQKLGKALQRIRTIEPVFLSIPVESGIQKLAISDIYYVEGQGHFAIFKTLHNEYSSRITLKDLEDQLEKYGFFRCGKGYLVNMQLVDSIQGGFCLIRNEKLPISRAKKKEFMELLIQYINKN